MPVLREPSGRRCRDSCRARHGQYFAAYDRLREASESLACSYALHEYRQFKGRTVLDVGCGDVYSKADLRRLLGRFADVECFVGCLQREMLPKLGRVIPEAWLRLFERR